jgi:hypothetical protein
MSDSPVQVEEKAVVESLIGSDEERQVFQFFFDLQAAGTTNMFDATRHLMRDTRFKHIMISKARDLLNRWMQHYQTLEKELAATKSPQE